ncbi:MAG TPA: FtsX-like permease family protein, partial [Opitutaceae bacterium]
MSRTPFITLLRWLTFRHWRQSAGQSFLLVGILALGVAVFVAIRLANRAAVASFSNFTETLTGQSDWVIRSPSGSMPESVLPEIRHALGTRPVEIYPVVEVSASRAESAAMSDKFGRPSYTLLGVDLLSLSNLARRQDSSFFSANEERGSHDESPSVWKTLSGPPRVWVSHDFSDTIPDHLDLILNERVQRVPVAGIIPSAPDAPRAPPTLLVLDLKQLQQLTGKLGQIDRVEFLIEPGPNADARRRELHDILLKLGNDGERWSVNSPGAQREAAETMTRAFRLNLTVLSLIALLVGLYLIFQALDGAVVKRRAEIAVLRSLGVEEKTIAQLWLLESALLGIIGGVLGVLIGWMGAQGAVRAVGQTVNALYYATTVHSANLTGFEIEIGVSVGVLASLIAGVWPALEAARTPPAQILQRSSPPAAGNRLLRSWPIGICLLAVGVICTRVPPWHFQGGGSFPVAGYATAFSWIIGCGLLCSFLLPLIAWISRGLGRRSPAVRIALSQTRTPSGRHRLA